MLSLLVLHIHAVIFMPRFYAIIFYAVIFALRPLALRFHAVIFVPRFYDALLRCDFGAALLRYNIQRCVFSPVSF